LLAAIANGGVFLLTEKVGTKSAWTRISNGGPLPTDRTDVFIPSASIKDPCGLIESAPLLFKAKRTKGRGKLTTRQEKKILKMREREK
jgi:hypothetical protein